MNRRAVVAGAVGIGFATAAGCLDATDDGETEDGTDAEAAEDDTDDEAIEPPFEIPTVDAPGSDGGTTTVPRPDRVTVVNATRMHCPTSEGLLSDVAAARADDDDAAFVSVLEDNTGVSDEDRAEWWAAHDGEWALGVDTDGHLFDHYDVRRIPEVLVVTPDGEVRWADENQPSAAGIERGIDRAREATASGEAADDASTDS